MNELYFNGFDKRYSFYDGENLFLLYFGDNGIGTLFKEDNKSVIIKWRLRKEFNILEVFDETNNMKILYKLLKVKDSLLTVQFEIKQNDEQIKKGKTNLLRTEEDITNSDNIVLTKMDGLFIFSICFIIFISISTILLFMPIIGRTGYLYTTFIAIGFIALFYKRISKFGFKLSKKYGEKLQNKINHIFYE